VLLEHFHDRATTLTVGQSALSQSINQFIGDPPELMKTGESFRDSLSIASFKQTVCSLIQHINYDVSGFEHLFDTK